MDNDPAAKLFVCNHIIGLERVCTIELGNSLGKTGKEACSQLAMSYTRTGSRDPLTYRKQWGWGMPADHARRPWNLSSLFQLLHAHKCVQTATAWARGATQPVGCMGYSLTNNPQGRAQAQRSWQRARASCAGPIAQSPSASAGRRAHLPACACSPVGACGTTPAPPARGQPYKASPPSQQACLGNLALAVKCNLPAKRARYQEE